MGISYTPHPSQLQLSPHEQVWAPPVQLQVDPQPQPMMKNVVKKRLENGNSMCRSVCGIIGDESGEDLGD